MESNAKQAGGFGARIDAGVRWAFPALVACWILRPRWDPIPLRVWLLLLTGLLVLGAWRRRAAFDRHLRTIAIALFVLTLVAAAAPALLNPELREPYILIERLLPALFGWAFILFLPLGAEGVAAGDVMPRTARRTATALVAVTFVAIAVTHALIAGPYGYIVDEMLYLLQASLFGEPGFGRAIDAALHPFFALKQTGFIDGRLITQYPPGWPALIAMFDAIGLRWWAGVACGVASIAFTYLLGARLHSRRAGLIAAALLASSQYVLILSASYFSHVPAMALLTAAAFLLVPTEDPETRAAFAHVAGAGFLLGWAVAMRPLTGVTLGAAIVAWTFLRTRPRPKRPARIAAALVAGGVLPIALTLLYNQTTTGHPLVFGYSAIHGEYHDLGFGPRGWIRYDETGTPVPDLIDFTPAVAARAFVGRVQELGLRVPPFFAIAPLLLIGFLYRFPFQWRQALPFLALPAAYFFYYYTSLRFLVEAFPFLFLALAAILAHVWHRQRHVGRALVAALITAQLLFTADNVHRLATERADAFFPLFDAARDARDRYGPIVVFVRETTREHTTLEMLSWFNIDEFPGDIVVARDLGERNALLLRTLPDHTPLRLDPVAGPELVPLVQGTGM